jgi:hypothetical protein
MSWYELLALSFWAGAIGWNLGWQRGLERGRREKEIRMVGRELTVTLNWDGVTRALDERGMVAMPKGVDFNASKATSE